MAGEQEEVVPGEEVKPEVKPEVHEYTNAEQRALAQGWVPEDQYQGHGKWRSAEDFLDRGELFAKIDDQNRRIKAMDATAGELRKHLEKVRKTEYNRALETLRAEKKSALVEGNADAVVEAEAKIDDLKEQYRQDEQQAVQVQQVQEAPPNPIVMAWMNRNSWYNTDLVMKQYADEIGQKLAKAGVMNPKDILDEVERRTKKEFADRFTNPNRNKSGSVEGGGSRGSKQQDTFQLTDEETRAMNRFVKAKLMTKEEYIADIKAERGV